MKEFLVEVTKKYRTWIKAFDNNEAKEIAENQAEDENDSWVEDLEVIDERLVDELEFEDCEDDDCE